METKDKEYEINFLKLNSKVVLSDVTNKQDRQSGFDFDVLRQDKAGNSITPQVAERTERVCVQYKSRKWQNR